MEQTDFDGLDWWNPSHSLLQNVRFKFDYFHAQIGPLAGRRILDVGCGGGLVSEELARRGAEVTGIDLSEHALRTARAHAAAGGLSIRYQRASAEALPFADGAFDAVVCADCLEHVDAPERVVAEAARVLARGGTFCFDTFNRNLLSRLVVGWLVERRLRAEYQRLSGSTGDCVIHDWRRFIKPAELAAMMVRHGLEPGDVQGIQLAGFRGGGLRLKVGGRPLVGYIGAARRGPAGGRTCARPELLSEPGERDRAREAQLP